MLHFNNLPLMKKTHSVIATILCSLFLLSCGVSPKGAETPKELIIAAKDAGSDTKVLKSCYYWSTAEEEANIDAMLSLKALKPEVDSFLEDGKKKFGEKFSTAFGMGTFVLAMATYPTPYDKMADGEYVETGDTAFVTAKIVEGNSTSTTKAEMIKKDAKWYFPAPSARGTKTPVEIAALMKGFFEASKKALNESDTAEKFGEAVNTYMTTKMN
jgi:hypothetical protein